MRSSLLSIDIVCDQDANPYKAVGNVVLHTENDMDVRIDVNLTVDETLTLKEIKELILEKCDYIKKFHEMELDPSVKLVKRRM